jgi:hypothetical protein
MNRSNWIGFFLEFLLPKCKYLIKVEIAVMDWLFFAPTFVKCTFHLAVVRGNGCNLERELTWGKSRVVIFPG